MRSSGHRLLAAGLASALCGCLSPIELNRAVIAYDTAADDVLSRELLLNIARAHYNEPLHFTAYAADPRLCPHTMRSALRLDASVSDV